MWTLSWGPALKNCKFIDFCLSLKERSSRWGKHLWKHRDEILILETQQPKKKKENFILTSKHVYTRKLDRKVTPLSKKQDIRPLMVFGACSLGLASSLSCHKGWERSARSFLALTLWIGPARVPLDCFQPVQHSRNHHQPHPVTLSWQGMLPYNGGANYIMGVTGGWY